MDHARIAAAVEALNLPTGTRHVYIRQQLDLEFNLQVSEATLQRVLKGALRNRNHLITPTDAELRDAIVRHQACNRDLIGAVLMLTHLRRHHGHWRISRQRVRVMLRLINPAAVQLRRAVNLHPRLYYSRGPDDVWHIDQYDKLKPFGFPIHACTDGYSRKVLWSTVVPSNNDPILIADIFLQYCRHIKGNPLTVRTDFGNENIHIEAAQRYFAFHQVPPNDPSWFPAHRLGSSTANTRIESTWSRTRRHGGDYWHQTFAELEHNGFIERNAQTKLMYGWQQRLLQIIVLPLFSYWLTDNLRTWNSHRIRKSHVASVPGVPDELYTAPITSAAFCLQPIKTEWIDVARSRACDVTQLAAVNVWMAPDEHNQVIQLLFKYRSANHIEDITMDNWTRVYCAIINQERQRFINEAINIYERKRIQP